MKTIIYTIIALLIGYYVGSHEIYMASDVKSDGSVSIVYPHAYNVKEALSFEREYANALMEGLHRFYSNDDNDFWFESFMRTPEYRKIDTLNGGDWEDFYYYETPRLESWELVYGTLDEPSEAYKNSINYGLI